MEKNQRYIASIGLAISNPAYLSAYEKLADAEYDELQHDIDACLVGLHDGQVMISIGEDYRQSGPIDELPKPVKLSDIHQLMNNQVKPTTARAGSRVHHQKIRSPKSSQFA